MEQNGTSLSTLPAEVLDTILEAHTSSFLVISLWKCGDKVLNYKLAHGGCKSVALKNGNWRSLTRYPRLLSSLSSLRNLSIERFNGFIMPLDMLSRAIRQLPSTLESLEIIANGAESCLLDFADGSTEAAPIFVLSQRKGRTTRLWDADAAFPRLTTLKLIGQSLLSSLQLNPSDLAHLPSNLTFLQLTNIPMEEDDDYFLRLPRTLTEIRGIFHGPFRSLEGFPPAVTRMEGFTNLNSRELCHLPSRMTDMGLYTVRFLWSRLDAERVPPSLTTLAITSIASASFSTKPWYEMMPLGPTSSLTELSMTAAKLADQLDVNLVLSLPRSLISLTWMAAINWESFESAYELSTGSDVDDFYKLWPKRLRSLTVNEDVSDGERVACAIFPRSLTSLRSIGHPTVPQSKYNLAHLPPELVELSLKCPLKTPLAPGLPKTLRALTIIGTILAPSTANLPDSLTDLCLYLPVPMSAMKYQIFVPSQLLKLAVSYFEPQHFHLLPKTLTELAIDKLGYLTQSDFHPREDPLKHLSHCSLMFLSIDGCFEPKLFSDMTASSLSKLTTFFCRAPVHFTPSILRHLPKSITTLWINLTTWDDAYMSFIQDSTKSLTFCVESRKTITSAAVMTNAYAFQFVPPTLISLSSQMKEEMHKRLKSFPAEAHPSQPSSPNELAQDRCSAS